MEKPRRASIAAPHHRKSTSTSSDAHRRGSVISSDNAVLSQLNPSVQSNSSITSRFNDDESGTHEHNITNIKYRGKSLSTIRYLKEQQMLHHSSTWVQKFLPSKPTSTTTSPTMLSKYGKPGHILGWGAFGTVRISHKLSTTTSPPTEQLFAIKQLPRRHDEPSKKHLKRITAEFCIAHALHHPNLIATLDLLQDAKGVYCQVMEYVPGGDLHTLILCAGQLAEREADCFFAQMVRGVQYMHEMGVAHRDIKPENILLTRSGGVKIADFGNAECFCAAWEVEARRSKGVCGSKPYMAPEVYKGEEFDARAVDVWACGTVYMTMRTGRYLWRVARREEDGEFERYVEERKTEEGFAPIEELSRVSLGRRGVCWEG